MHPHHRAALSLSLTQQGFCTITVSGRSMVPFVNDGDRLEIVPPPAQLCRGMVVALFNADQLVVHRIIRISRQTKSRAATLTIAGDSSGNSVATVAAQEIVGIVARNQSSLWRNSIGIKSPGRWIALWAGYVLRRWMAGQ